jgi:hypothetical protein
MPPSRDCRDSGLVHYVLAKRDDIAASLNHPIGAGR